MILTIFGYPKTGKTLLFNLLTDQQEEISKYSTPSTTCHKAIIDVPDPRLEKLAENLNLPPVHARIEYLDTGPISFGEVKNSTFIDLLRRADGLVHVARGFSDPELLHPEGSIDPLRDIRKMEEELILVDLISIEKRLERLEIDLKKMKSKELQEEFEVLGRLRAFLDLGKPLRLFPWKPHEEQLTRGYKFLTLKPLLNMINADETSYESFLTGQREPEGHTATIVFCAKIEKELLELPESDRAVFEREFGLKGYSYVKENFITASYRLMNLISFFTIGKQETKAWTINRNTPALEAAGKIHSDIQQGFIRAEVIPVTEFLEAGGFSQARERGILRLEGKDYIINDGEIVHFRFGK